MNIPFQVERYGSSAITEIIAGITSFLAMSYILAINPLVMQGAGMPFAGVFVATALSTGICTLFLAFYANTPYTMAPAMSSNAYFAGAICIAQGFAWQEALCIGFAAGLLQMAIMLGRFRRPFVNHALPESIKLAGIAGIGALIAIGGVNYAGLAAANAEKSDNVAFNIAQFAEIMPPVIAKSSYSNLVAIVGLLAITFLFAFEKKTGDRYGAVPMGILAATFLGIPLGVTNLTSLHPFDGNLFEELRAVSFALFGDPGLLSLVRSPDRLLPACVIVIMVATFVGVDELVSVVGTGSMRRRRVFSRREMEGFAGEKDPTGRVDRTLIAGSLGTVIGPLLGSPPCGIFVESALPIATGGRTGLTALVSGTLFLASIPLVNLFHIVPAEVVGAALVLAGVFPLMAMREIDWDDFEQTIPAGLCILLIVAMHNFIVSVTIGVLVHVVIQATLGKWKQLHPVLLITGCLLLATSVFLQLAGV